MPANVSDSIKTMWGMEDHFSIQEVRWASERIALAEDYYHSAPNPEDLAIVENEADRLLTMGWNLKRVASALETIKADAKRWVAREAHKYFDPPES